MYIFLAAFCEISNIAIVADSLWLWLRETSNFVFGISLTWDHPPPPEEENWISMKTQKARTFVCSNSPKLSIFLCTLKFYHTDIIQVKWRPGEQYWKSGSSIIYSRYVWLVRESEDWKSGGPIIPYQNKANDRQGKELPALIDFLIKLSVATSLLDCFGSSRCAEANFGSSFVLLFDSISFSVLVNLRSWVENLNNFIWIIKLDIDWKIKLVRIKFVEEISLTDNVPIILILYS